MSLPLHELLPLRSVFVTLRFTGPAAPRFFHQAALAALLRGLGGGAAEFDRTIRLDTPENGRVAYAAGDGYRFGLLALAGGEDLLARLLEGLRGLPASAPRGGTLPFGGNLECVALHDGFSGQPVGGAAQLGGYGLEELEREAAAWAGTRDWGWEFLSPARLLKDKARRGQATGEGRYGRELDELPPALLLQRSHDSLAELLRRRGGTAEARPAPPAVRSGGGQVFWVALSYADAEGREHPMGGVLGRVLAQAEQALPTDWLKLLLLGQHTGIGQRTAFGLGRYRLLRESGGGPRRCPPTRSLLARASEESNLREAYRHIRANLSLPRQEAGDEDEDWLPPEPDDGEEACVERAGRVLEKLAQGRYPPPPLLGFVKQDRDGGLRPLAAPPFLDRVAQRAVAQALGPGLESLQYAHSYGYRPGRSRLDARYAAQAGWREGFRWVYESDIADFFDSVDWDTLALRLRGLYGEEPALAAILAWIAAPVSYQGELIQRRQGLPQGSPLSPLLANLLLDDFDRDLENAGFRLLRFADDFIVLCKTPQQAQEAHAAARASLADHGLALNPGKTRVAAMADGFRYLGYLFLNDLAVDVSGQRADTQPPKIPPLSWLARAGRRPPLPLPAPDAPLRTAPTAQTQALATAAEADTQGTLLCVAGDGTLLSTDGGHLRVSRGEALLHELPWQQLQAVLLFGQHQLTEPALRAALRSATPVHFASAAGTYRGLLWDGQPKAPGHGLWLRQASLFADPPCALELARTVVEARLRQQREILRRRGLAGAGVEESLTKLPKAADLAALNGLEGAAARAYFHALAQAAPAAFGFHGRNRRPPEDPFNALLSLGYTVLHGYADSILRADGLLPWLGFYHQSRGRHAALASDLIEPFRHVVESVALGLLARGVLTPADFVSAEGGACLLRKEPRRRYLLELLERFATPVKASGEEEAQSIPQHLHTQNLSLIRHLQAGERFVAWRTR